MKRIIKRIIEFVKDGKPVIVIGVVGLFAVIGTVLYSYYPYLNPLYGYTPQEIEQMGIEKVNINTADAEELGELPWLSEQQIQSIIDYRTEYGNFADIKEIISVKGIDKKTYEKIELYITAK